MSDWTLRSQRSFDLSLAVESIKLDFLFGERCVDSRQHQLGMSYAIVVMGFEATRCWNRLYVGEAVSRVSRRNLVGVRWLLAGPL